MLDITILTIGKLKSSACLELADDYFSRLKRMAKIKVIELPGGRFSEGQAKLSRQQDSQKVLEWLKNYPDSQVYLMAEQGQEHNSLSWSSMMTKWDADGKKIILIIGGAAGLDPDILNKAIRLSLSGLTWPHEIARVLLLEQLYRGLMISGGKDYHY
ncbi:MAG TPA: 23S rRNA (pseudouridine(1915)-N(3))-methyltransferase RlmH [bacterium]|nr:23S rRNA (pseudouridine(1915)-N(3))-methyltransferase RlmH [bacterium]